MKKKLLLVLVLVGLLSINIFTELFSNLWFQLTTRGYFIPMESNIFTFKPTIWNDGSGEWWLYGEDNKYYYGLNIDRDNEKSSKRLIYFKILRTDVGDEYFNKHDYKTWFE